MLLPLSMLPAIAFTKVGFPSMRAYIRYCLCPRPSQAYAFLIVAAIPPLRRAFLDGGLVFPYPIRYDGISKAEDAILCFLYQVFCGKVTHGHFP